jgi:FkbM family methyltransferase
MHKKLEDFDWGAFETDELKDIIIRELIDGNIYSRFFDVREGDVVVDVGASVGPFSYFISNNKPLQIYTFEPSKKEFPTLCKNMLGLPSCNINKAIWDGDGITNSIDSDIYFWDGYIETIKFKTFLNLYNVKKIDFLKTDCEGGEYHIINDENIEFILENVGVIAGEWHLETAEKKEKFRKFRDYYLPMFKSHEVYSVDGIDIKWDLHNEHFLHYYNQVIVYIDNRK